MGVQRADGVWIGWGSKYLTVGKLLNGGSVHVVGRCEARHMTRAVLQQREKEGKSLTETQKAEGKAT